MAQVNVEVGGATPAAAAVAAPGNNVAAPAEAAPLAGGDEGLGEQLLAALADLPPGGPAGAAAAYDEDDDDVEEAASEGDPPPPPVADPTATLDFAFEAYNGVLDRLPLAEGLHLSGYNMEVDRPDKLAVLAERLGAQAVWICGPLKKMKNSDKLQAFGNQSAQGVCGTPGCRRLTVPKVVAALRRPGAADRFRCDRCPSGWMTGWNFSADGRAQLGFPEGGKCEYTPDALEAALQERLTEVAERLGVGISGLQQEGDVGTQTNGQDVDISSTVVSVPCCTQGCAARVSNQINAWLRRQAGAPVRCGYHAFEFDACRRVLGFLSSGPGHLLTPTLDQVRLDQVRLTTGGARTCECTVFYGPCHNALVQGKGCTNSVQRTGQAFRKRVPVCDECMYRWDELKDYANVSRLFATDPHSRVEAIALHDHAAVGVGGEQPRRVGVVLQLIPAILQASVCLVWAQPPSTRTRSRGRPCAGPAQE